jgi:hypothetical protein
MIVGGFPELALTSDDFQAQRVLREDIVDKVLKRDLPSLYNIRSIVDMERIFLYLCFYSSNIISMDAIAKELQGVTRPTVERYIHYLASANLIYISNPIDLSGKKVLKAQPKIYIADAAIRNAVLCTQDLLSNPAELGLAVETAVYKHVHAFTSRRSASVGYYRKSGQEGEIDVVVDFYIRRVLIEVKYREQISVSLKSLLVTALRSQDTAFLITKSASDHGPFPGKPEIYRIPAFAFLYLLGHAEKHGNTGVL